MNKDTQFMSLAIEQAKNAKEAGEWPFGAVLVSNNEVIAVGMVIELFADIKK